MHTTRPALVALALMAWIGTAWAQDPSRRSDVAAGGTLAEKAARRFPQPVRVGDLVGRQVLEPSQHQGVLGRVDGVARDEEGLKLVVRYGGVLGFFTRPIAIPVDATALLGQFVQVTDVPVEQVAALPSWTGAGATRLGADAVVRIGVNRN